MAEYRYVRLDDQNLKDLLFLYKEAFNEVTSISFLMKKYDTSLFGSKHVGFIAYHVSTAQPAAYYGVFPVKMECNGEELLAAQSGDTMTHPEHRGKGLFIALATSTYVLAKELGIHFIFGFPNKNSYPGFVNKLNWKHYSNVNHYKFKGSVFPMDKIAKKFPFLKAFHDLILPSKVIKAANGFPNSLSSQGKFLGNVKHNDLFFTYKGYGNSFIVIVEGVKCWLKVDGRLWVGDVEYCDEQKFNRVIDGLVLFAKKKLCSGLVFSVMENSLYDNLLRKRSQHFSSIAVGCLDLSGVYKPERFAYQGGDFDTF